MPQYEYKVVPAPVKGAKTRGVKGTRERFAHTLMTLMNEMGRDGWEYLRADSLPCEERQGLTGKTTSFQNLLIFRREIPAAPAQEAPSTPEEIAATAAASLRAEAEEGSAPALERGSEGAAPGVGPAASADDPDRRDGVAAE
jgi:hypothetical protein